jgi:F-type H+-transporting ATPase subunit b
LENLGLSLGYLIVQILMFAITAIVINAWVIKPLLGVLEKRRATIAMGMEDARVAAEARANAEEQAAKIVKDAQAKATEIVRDASDRAEAAVREIKAEADADIAKSRENVKQELEQERSVLLGNLRSQVITLSMSGAQKLIGESLMQDEKHQRALLDEFFSGVKGGKVVVLSGKTLSGSEAEVTTALPLTADEKTRVQSEILQNLGKEAKLNFRIDPNILGGMVIRVGDRVIDGSIASQLANLKQTLI